MADGLQSLRPLVEERSLGHVVRGLADRRRSRVAEYRQYDEPRAPARRGWKRGPAVQGIGRSRGGATTKVHLVVDALGLPLAFELTEGQRHDIVPAPGLVQRTKPRCLLADKAYSTHDFRALLDTIACEPVIPSSSSWIDPPAYDKEVYKARAEVECTFNLLKQARRFATRYEKTLRNYAAVVAIGCALLWLRI
jgi:transposase